MRALGSVVLVGCGIGCGGKPGGPAPIDNAASSPVADGVIREGACPPGTLELLASGWPDWALDDDGLHPQLDVCLHGELIGPSVVVYASAPPAADSQREDGYPLRRVIIGHDLTLLAEGPAGGGDWMVGAASLEALVDLDGDGRHEIVETDGTSVMSTMLRVWRLDGRQWLEAGTVMTGIEDGGYTCTSTWTASPPDATGRRTLVVEVQERGEREVNEYSGEAMNAGCPSAGTHHYALDGGLLSDQDAAPIEGEGGEGDEEDEGGESGGEDEGGESGGE